MRNNKLQQFGIILTLSVFILMISAIVSAAVPGGATIATNTDKGAYPTPAAGALNVTAGNISQVSLTSDQQTFRWVGLYGNVSGSIKLGNSASNVLYAWSSLGKYVYASTSNAISWTTVVPSNITGMLTTYPYLQNGTDNYTQTFTSTGTVDSEILGIITNVPEAKTYNSTGGQIWPTYSLTDGANILFTSPVNASGANSFSNEQVNYQMIIPENGLNQDTNPTEYYLWVELV